MKQGWNDLFPTTQSNQLCSDIILYQLKLLDSLHGQPYVKSPEVTKFRCYQGIHHIDKTFPIQQQPLLPTVYTKGSLDQAAFPGYKLAHFESSCVFQEKLPHLCSPAEDALYGQLVFYPLCIYPHISHSLLLVWNGTAAGAPPLCAKGIPCFCAQR